MNLVIVSNKIYLNNFLNLIKFTISFSDIWSKNSDWEIKNILNQLKQYYLINWIAYCYD